jgi:hypothetical protein
MMPLIKTLPLRNLSWWKGETWPGLMTMQRLKRCTTGRPCLGTKMPQLTLFISRHLCHGPPCGAETKARKGFGSPKRSKRYHSSNSFAYCTALYYRTMLDQTWRTFHLITVHHIPVLILICVQLNTEWLLSYVRDSKGRSLQPLAW